MMGPTLKKLRNIYGFTAAELSEALGISKSHLSEIENGKEPSLDVLKRYSDVMGIKLSSLILLTERYDEAESMGKGDELTRRIMNKVIDLMARGLMDDGADE